MPLKFHNKNECPPGGFRFFVRDTGRWIEGIDWQQFTNNVKQHYRSNNLPIGLLFNETIEDQACQNTDPSACYQCGPETQRAFRAPTSYEQLRSATSTMLRWFLEGKRKVSKDEVERRSKICISCPLNVPAKDCPSCGNKTIMDLVSQFVGGETTEYDIRIQACSVCGCSLKAKTRIPLDILKANEPAILKGAFPDYCWLATPKS